MNNFELNKIYTDDFGRVDGIVAVDKPVGKTSHDIVAEYRKKYLTKRVGHAGALDPFASGLVLILLGKATKLSDQFLGLDKEYEADILFGVSTDTEDLEGKILKTLEGIKLNETILQKTLQSFMPEYAQTVPVFSSVKVNGDKLRVLARKYDGFDLENNIAKFYKLVDSKKEYKKEVELPVKTVKISNINLLGISSFGDWLKSQPENKYLSSFIEKIKDELPQTFAVAKVRVECSKGTYIRQLAVDIGNKLDMPAMLVGLRRTRIGSYKMNNV